MPAGGLNDRCRLISASVGIELGFRKWRERLFKQPRPRGWFPEVGDRVYLRPGTSLGGLLHTEATVWRLNRKSKKVNVRVQRPGGTWATREVEVGDVRPKAP